MFISLSIPFGTMIYSQRALSDYSSWFFIYLGCSILLIALYSPLYTFIFYCAVFDVKRQETMHALLRAMIRLTDLGD